MPRTHTERPAQNALLHRRRRGFLLHCLAYLFVNARHTHDHRRPHFLHRLRQLFKLRAVGHLRPGVVHHVIQRARRHVRERKERNARVLRTESKINRRHILVGGDIAVRKLHALRLAGCAGGVNQRGQFVAAQRIALAHQIPRHAPLPRASAPASSSLSAIAPCGAGASIIMID